MREHIVSLQRQIAEAKARLRALVAKAEGENRNLTVEEQAAFKTDETAVTDLKARLERAETVEREQAKTVTPILDPATPPTPGQPAQAAGIQVKPNGEEKPWGPTAKTAFGNFLAAVYKAEPRVKGEVDPRLLKKAAAGTNEGVDSEGGFAVDSQALGMIDKIAFDNTDLAARCFQVEVGDGFNGATIPIIDETSRVAGSRFGGIRVYHADEGDTVTATKPKVRKTEVKLQKMFALWHVSDEELADAAYLGSVGLQAFGEEIAFQVDEDLFDGTGAGQCLGVLRAPSVVSVAIESGQTLAGNPIDEANLRKMRRAMPARSRGRAVWLVHADVEAELLSLSLPIGTGGAPLYLPPGGWRDEPYGLLWGAPVIVNEHSKALGTKGDIMFADLGWYALVHKSGVQIASSAHARFIYDEMSFRITYRVNGLPMLSSSITPARGSNAISPFVTLDART